MEQSKISIISYILGLLSVVLNWVLCWLPVASQILCMALGITAIILGSISLKRNYDRRGLAIAGIILGAIGLVYGAIALLARGLAAFAVKRELLGKNEETFRLIESAQNK